jgi:hypothetical protein
MKASLRGLVLAGTSCALIAVALACNVAGVSQPDSGATVQAVYATITAHAGTLAGGTQSQAVTATPGGAAASGTPPAPSITATPPDSRSGNGTNLTFTRCARSLSIDAELGDWAAAGEIARFALSDNTHGAGNWTGADDLSGTARVCWTDTALYVAIEITDDVHVQTETGGTAWKGDEVELLFDGDLPGDYYDEMWDTDDTQIGLSPGDFEALLPAAVRFFPSVATAEDVRLAARQAGATGDYVLEAEVRWRALRATPQQDRSYGFCLALSDNDTPGEAAQQSMVSHCSRLVVYNPSTWISARLGE